MPRPAEPAVKPVQAIRTCFIRCTSIHQRLSRPRARSELFSNGYISSLRHPPDSAEAVHEPIPAAPQQEHLAAIRSLIPERQEADAAEGVCGAPSPGRSRAIQSPHRRYALISPRAGAHCPEHPRRGLCHLSASIHVIPATGGKTIRPYGHMTRDEARSKWFLLRRPVEPRLRRPASRFPTTRAAAACRATEFSHSIATFTRARSSTPAPGATSHSEMSK